MGKFVGQVDAEAVEFELILLFPDVQSHIVDAPLGAGPESILPVVVMDSGLARFARAPE